MTQQELIKRLETTCFGLDPIDPLRLLVDDVIEALTQPQRTWVGLTDEEYIHITDSVYHQGHGLVAYYKAIEAKLRERNT